MLCKKIGYEFLWLYKNYENNQDYESNPVKSKQCKDYVRLDMYLQRKEEISK